MARSSRERAEPLAASGCPVDGHAAMAAEVVDGVQVDDAVAVAISSVSSWYLKFKSLFALCLEAGSVFRRVVVCGLLMRLLLKCHCAISRLARTRNLSFLITCTRARRFPDMDDFNVSRHTMLSRSSSTIKQEWLVGNLVLLSCPRLVNYYCECVG